MLFQRFFLASVSLFFCVSDPFLVFGSDARSPNVILIVADDLGYGDISPYGGWIKTPHLEALAKVHGALAERARGTLPLSNTIVKIPEQDKWKRHAEALEKLSHVYAPVEQTLATLCAL